MEDKIDLIIYIVAILTVVIATCSAIVKVWKLFILKKKHLIRGWLSIACAIMLIIIVLVHACQTLFL